MAVTRSEIADHIADVPLPADRSDLLAAAVTSGASPELITLLESLPPRTFGTLRDLWPYLRHVPID
ncbi:DUF2795 domain-containing protein [Catenulispora rubra]|uniref:DUF2795 domain-containing protein n=1 Tax=Catenulispora rubra TaxID=280293 RepID=UPI0018925C32|nr:DUF2795 domain-containing protein [Catenulispora rubra]